MYFPSGRERKKDNGRDVDGENFQVKTLTTYACGEQRLYKRQME